MKTIAPAAMAAIEAGEAIVTGAVEIIPVAGASVLMGAAFDTGTFTLNGVPVDPETIFDGYTTDLLVPDEGLMVDTDNPDYSAMSLYLTTEALAALPSHFRAVMEFYLEGETLSGDALVIFDALDVDNNAAGFSATRGESFPTGLAATREASGTTLDNLPGGVAQGWHTVELRVPNPVSASLDDGAADAGPSVPTPVIGPITTVNVFMQVYGTTYAKVGIKSVTIYGASTGGAAGTPIRLWGGYGPITFATDDGDQTFEGIGARGLAQQNAGALGGVAQGMTLSLSGVEPDALKLLDSDEIKGASVVIYRLIFASDGKTLLDAHVFDRGRVDTVDTDETVGGTANINVAVESAARGLGRAGARMRADSDQRLIDTDDGYFKATAYAGQKSLYWGGKKPFSKGG